MAVEGLNTLIQDIPIIDENLTMIQSVIIIGYVGYILYILIYPLLSSLDLSEIKVRIFIYLLSPLWLYIYCFFSEIMASLFLIFLFIHLLYYLISKNYSLSQQKNFKYLNLNTFSKQLINYFFIIFTSVLIRLIITTLTTKFLITISDFISETECNILCSFICFWFIYSISLTIIYIFIIYYENIKVFTLKNKIKIIFFNIIILTLIRNVLFIVCPWEYYTLISVWLIPFILPDLSFYIKEFWIQTFNCLNVTFPKSTILCDDGSDRDLKAAMNSSYTVEFIFTKHQVLEDQEVKWKELVEIKFVEFSIRDLYKQAKIFNESCTLPPHVLKQATNLMHVSRFSIEGADLRYIFTIGEGPLNVYIVPFNNIHFMRFTAQGDDLQDVGAVSLFKKYRGNTHMTLDILGHDRQRLKYVDDTILPNYKPIPEIFFPGANKERVMYDPAIPSHQGKPLYVMIGDDYKRFGFNSIRFKGLPSYRLSNTVQIAELYNKYNIGVFRESQQSQ